MKSHLASQTHPLRADPMTGTARNHDLVPFDFGPRRLSGLAYPYRGVVTNCRNHCMNSRQILLKTEFVGAKSAIYDCLASRA